LIRAGNYVQSPEVQTELIQVCQELLTTDTSRLGRKILLTTEENINVSFKKYKV
jgi:hypothetical protein